MKATIDGSARFDKNDIHSAALCAWKEARGEGANGMSAVLHVLHNRVGHPGFYGSLHAVIFSKDQFTSMSVPSDPEFNLQPAADDEGFVNAQGLANEIFGEAGNTLTDPTHGAHYYANLHTMDPDGWFYREIVLKGSLHPIAAQIGKHTFFV